MRCYLSVASWLFAPVSNLLQRRIFGYSFGLLPALQSSRGSVGPHSFPLFNARLPDPWIPVVSESPGSTSSRFQLMTLAARLTRPEKPAYPLVEPGSEPGREKSRCRCPNVVNSVGH